MRLISLGMWGVLAIAAAGTALGSGCSDDTGTGGAGCTEIDAQGCFDMACFTKSDKAVSFKTDVLPIFEQSCSLSASCHGSPTNPETAAGYQPYLGEVSPETTPSDVALIFSTNVGQASHRAPALKIIDPGSPETSFLMNKIDGALECASVSCTGGSCGTIMPQGSDVMELSRRDVVRQWIQEGAQNN